MFTFSAFQHWSLSRATMVSMIQPPLVLAMAMVFLRKTPAPQELLGGMLILAGAAGLVWIHFFAGRRDMRITETTERRHG
jgi:drug/metabolite transporter (DMT)-like permease